MFAKILILLGVYAGWKLHSFLIKEEKKEEINSIKHIIEENLKEITEKIKDDT